MDISVIIPSRNEQFLVNTIEDIFAKAESQFEVIVVCDGYNPILPEHPNLTKIVYNKAKGMRNAINVAVSIASGKYLLKSDAHIMFDEGFDVKLMADIKDDWVSIPTRKRLDAENWCIQDVGKPDIEANYLSFPDDPNDFGGPGLNGRIWTEKILKRKDVKIDDEIGFQGSCWFMPKKYFEFLELMDEKHWGSFWNEAQEIAFKAWLSGGRVIRNKKTWYAHLHKGNKYGRGYNLDNSQLKIGATYTRKWLVNNKMWHKQKYPLTWLINKFMPMPGWDKSWIEPNTRDELALYFAKLGFKKGAEIGVEQGKYSEVLCKAGLKVYAIDAWTAYKGYRDHVSQEKLDSFLEITKKRLAPYNHRIIKSFSIDAVKKFADESLDFVYIDANHEFQNITNDIAEWSKKVRKGGIVSGHDFKRYKGKYGLDSCHVKDVVQAWANSHKLDLHITNGDKSPSWWWIKK